MPLIRHVVSSALVLASSLSFVRAVPAQQATSEPKTPTLSAAELQDYVGLYRVAEEPDTVRAIYLRAGELVIDSEREIPMPLKASAKDHLFLPEIASSLDFHRDAQTNVVSFSFKSPQNISGGGRTWQRFSREGQALNHGQTYGRTEAMVPVRDGAKLHIVILRPVGSDTGGPPLPVLLTRTPYGVAGSNNDSLNYSKPELSKSGYIFVYADIRGRYGSEGQFVMNRPVVHVTGDRSDPKLVDESTDCYDTVGWLVKNLPNNNGRVGVLGVSYPGFLAMMAGVDHHPAVKAISPQAPMTDVWLGDDFFHNGAFRQTYGFDYVQQLEKAKDDQVVSSTADTYDYFLQHTNFAGAAADAKMSALPTARRFLTEPNYTKFWQDMAVQKRLSRPEVPTLEVGGWYDQEDMWGTQAEYAALRAHEDSNDPQHRVFLALGPWNHGGWASSSRHLAAVDFGAPTGDQFRKGMEAPFFELYLKDKPGFDLEDTASFRTGVNQWQRYPVWPPQAGFHSAKLYLGANGSLGFNRPQGEAPPVAYVADPAKPIPYRARPVQSTYGQGSKWRTWLATDQRFSDGRTDYAAFQSPALDHDVTVTGDVGADLYASTTGTDGDWIVKLIDVYPKDAPEGMGGYQLMIAEEIFRGRYAKSFEKPEPIPAGKVQEYRWSLHGADHTFLKGHRMMVEVQSSWFPLYDRNPQTFVPNIMSAPAGAYQAQTIKIYADEQHPSHLEVLRPDAEELMEASAAGR